MKKLARGFSVVPLTCVLSVLPFSPMLQNLQMEASPTSLMSVHVAETKDSTELAASSVFTIEDELIPLAEGPGFAATSLSIPCTVGILNYYNQGDPRWADTLYGPTDPMKSHGCGPTAVAMVVSSFTGQNVTPVDIAQWASESGYCSPGEGSKHQLIPDALTHYGLTVSSLPDRSVESVLNAIKNGQIVVALMNKGHFTNGGHFLLLTQVTEDGQIRIADPADWNNSTMAWDPQLILDEVRKKADGGGPLWAIGMPPET